MANSIPRKIEDLYVWVSELMIWVLANLIAKGFDSQFVKDKLEPLVNRFIACFNAYKNPETRSPAVVADLNRAKEEMLPEVAIMVEMIKFNQLTTKAEKDKLRIATGHGGGLPPSPPPVTFPVLTERVYKTPAPGRLTIEYRDFGQKLEGKPEHVSHLELIYDIADEPIKSRTLLTKHMDHTNSPIIIDSPEELRKKVLSASGRWVTTSGEAGPWSPIVSFIIP
jgi:hypothetical protein